MPPAVETNHGPGTADDEPDGRRARRERNRDAVVEALLDLYTEGELDPSADAIAERAGISARSLFRYFDDIDDLCRAAMIRQQVRLLDHFGEPVDPSLPLRERIDAFVARRAALFDAVGGVGVAARVRAPFQPLIAEQLARGNAHLFAEVRLVFAPELEQIGEPTAGAVLAAAEVLTSFEAHRLLRHDRAMSRPRAARALTESLLRLFAEFADPNATDKTATRPTATRRPRGDRR